MTVYRLREDQLHCGDIGGYIAYGIDAFDDLSAQPVCSIKDISTEKENVKALISLCNHLNLDIIHINDVIEDFFS